MSPDTISNLIRSHSKGPLNFGFGGERQLDEVEHVATVSGRSVRVRIENGEAYIRGQAMIFRKGDELVAIEGGNPHRLQVDDLRKILSKSDADKLIAALENDTASKKKRVRQK